MKIKSIFIITAVFLCFICAQAADQFLDAKNKANQLIQDTKVKLSREKVFYLLNNFEKLKPKEISMLLEGEPDLSVRKPDETSILILCAKYGYFEPYKSVYEKVKIIMEPNELTQDLSLSIIWANNIKNSKQKNNLLNFFKEVKKNGINSQDIMIFDTQIQRALEFILVIVDYYKENGYLPENSISQIELNILTVLKYLKPKDTVLMSIYKVYLNGLKQLEGYEQIINFAVEEQCINGNFFQDKNQFQKD